MPTRHVRHSRELVRFGRKRLQRRAIDLFEQLPARHAEPPDRALFVEMRHQLADRRVDLRQAVKGSMAQPPEKPSLNDEHRLLDFCFIPRPPRPRWQNGGVVMRRHLGVGSIDLRIVETGLDDGRLGIVRHEQMRNAADRLEGTDMGVDPVGQRLRPARMRKSEARRAEHGDEDLRLADFAGQPVDDDRNPIAGVIDEQPLAGRVRLPHRRRQLRFKAAIELAKPRIAVAAGIGGDIFIPDDHQGDVLALQLPMNRRPIRLGVPAMAPFGPVIGVKRRLQVAVAHAVRQGPTQPGALETPQRLAHRRSGDAQTTRDFARRNAGGKLQTNDLARLAHRNSFRWHHRSLGLPKEGP